VLNINSLRGNSTAVEVQEKMFRKENGAIDMISLILMIVISAITLMVGIVLVASFEQSMPTISCAVNDTYANLTLHNFSYTTMAGSCDSVETYGTAMDNILSGSGTAFTFLALGLFVLASIFIIGIVAGVLGGNQE